MINKIKYVMYKYKLYTPDNIFDKVSIIKESNVDLSASTTKLSTLCTDITKYISELEYLTNNDVYQIKKQIKNINSNTYNTQMLSIWLTNNGYILNDYKSVLNKWLDLSLKLIKIYELSKKNNDNINLTTNAYRMSPYIKNINTILDEIYSLV